MKKERTKKFKRIRLGIILGVLALIIAMLTTWFTYVDPSLSKKVEHPLTNQAWMENLKDEAKITEIVIPGSHDAGTKGMMPQAMTQGHTILEQLQAGVRYFDTRITDKGDKLVVFHGPIKGELFSNILNDFKSFINSNPSEFMIIDFQHLGNKHEPIIKMIKEYLPMNRMLKRSSFPDISQVTMADIRSNNLSFMITWKNEEEALANDFYIREASLSSQYNGNKHKEGNEALIKEFSNYYNNYEANKLFVLQAQRTAKSLLGKPSIYEKSFKPIVNEYIKDLANKPTLLAKTNIIMRDFIASDIENIKLILSLNSAKNLYKK